MRIIVRYDPNNTKGCLPDGLIQKRVEENIQICKDYFAKDSARTMSWDVSQELEIGFIRVAIAKGILDFSTIEFDYQAYVMYPDRYGRLDKYPQGFCDYYDKVLEALLESLEALLESYISEKENK